MARCGDFLISVGEGALLLIRIHLLLKLLNLFLSLAQVKLGLPEMRVHHSLDALPTLDFAKDGCHCILVL